MLKAKVIDLVMKTAGIEQIKYKGYIIFNPSNPILKSQIGKWFIGAKGPTNKRYYVITLDNKFSVGSGSSFEQAIEHQSKPFNSAEEAKQWIDKNA
jgi:hypothetical protein